MDLKVQIGNQTPKLEIDFQSSTGRLAIFGPSGAGKTTALKIIAGLLRPDQANIVLNGEQWNGSGTNRPAHMRRAAFVFQDDRLFPHMSVAKNLTYGAQNGEQQPLDQLIELTGISSLMDRSVHTLSGGERKRVAIARALAASPALLLLDEPYAGLDRPTADRLRHELAVLLEQLKVPHILVSHQLDDVLAHAREVLLLENGIATGFGPPEQVFESKAGQKLIGLSDETLAAGPTTVFRVTRNENQNAAGVTSWSLGNGASIVLAGQNETASNAYVRIRGSDVSLATEKPGNTSILNVMEAEVISLTPVSDFVDVKLTLGETPENQSSLFLFARITSYSAKHLGLVPRQKIYAMIKSAAITH